MNALTRSGLALSVVAVLAGPDVSAAAMATTATDGQISINTGDGWTQNPTTPLFDTTDAAPGWTQTATLGVRNDSDNAAALVIDTTDVVDDENGCNLPESDVDTTCTGANAGELGKDILLSVYADPENDGSFEPSPTWTGTIDALEQGARLSARLAPGATASYKLVAVLPASTGNETQSDRVAFDLLVRLDGVAPGVTVEGTKITRHRTSALHQIANALPFTGPLAMRFAAAGLSLVLAGLALILLAAQRRRRTGRG